MLRKFFAPTLFLSFLTLTFFAFAQFMPPDSGGGGGYQPPGGGDPGGGGGPPGGGGMQLQLSVSIKGDGGGSISSNPPGLSCGGGTCVANFAMGVNVTLTAAADSNSAFGGWEGDCVSSSGSSCSLMMNANKQAAAIFNVSSQASSGGDTYYYDDYFNYDPFDLYAQEVKKRRQQRKISVFDNLYNFTGKKKYARENIRRANWSITTDGKLRGSLLNGNVMMDLVSGYSQLSFRGGRKGLTGQVAYYILGNSNVTELIDFTNRRIYVEELMRTDDYQLYLALLFNGPVDQPTLFGRLYANQEEEQFFITNPKSTRGVSIYPLVTKAPIILPISRFGPPSSLIEKFFEGWSDFAEPLTRLLYNRAVAAITSFSQLPRLRTELISLQSDVEFINQIIIDYQRVVAKLDNPDSLTEADYEIISQFGDVDMVEWEDLLRSYGDRINFLIMQLGGLNVLNRTSLWFQLDADDVENRALVKSLGISESLVGLLRFIPRPFVVSVIKNGKVVMISCNGMRELNCEKSAAVKSLEDFIKKEAVKYEAVLDGESQSYRALGKEVEMKLFSL